MKRPAELYFLILLHLMLSAGALFGGFLLIIDSSGSLLGMEPGWLADSPFEDYRVPGILLFICLGLFPLLTAAGLLLRPKWTFWNHINIYPASFWAWTTSLYSGIILISWISVQVLMTNYFWLQPVLTFVGLLIIVSTMLPRIVAYYSGPR